MAEQTGVQSTSGGNEPRTGGENQKLTSKKNRKWLYIGGAGVAILLLGHKGGQSSAGGGTDPNAALQAQSDYAAQRQADAALAGALEPGGVAPTTIDTGSGGGTAMAPSEVPSGISDSTLPLEGVDNTTGASPDASSALEGADTSLDAALVAQNSKNAPPPNEAPRHNRGKPANKKGETKHPSHGSHVQGHTGATAHGRHFPGAKSVTIGAPRNVHGNLHEDVTVNFGGHTEVHTSVNGGHHWIDNTRGKNPPSRGPQAIHHAASHPTTAVEPRAAAPAPRSAPRAAPRAAAPPPRRRRR